MKPCITTNSKNLMYDINRPSLSCQSVSKRSDCDENLTFFYSHANQTYYHKKDLHLALLRESEGLWNSEIAC